MPTIDEDGEVSIANHFGEGKAFPGGPVCEFKGKKIPTLVQWSEHGGITGEILTNVLKKLDCCGVIDRTDASVKPFLWQVADSEQLNGELTRLFTIAKENLLRKKTHHGLAPSITRTDVMPMFAGAWKQSFGDVKMNLKAMSARGWSVLNYALLDHLHPI